MCTEYDKIFYMFYHISSDFNFRQYEINDPSCITKQYLS